MRAIIEIMKETSDSVNNPLLFDFASVFQQQMLQQQQMLLARGINPAAMMMNQQVGLPSSRGGALDLILTGMCGPDSKSRKWTLKMA